MKTLPNFPFISSVNVITNRYLKNQPTLYLMHGRTKIISVTLDQKEIMSSTNNNNDADYQNVLVMRHGDRMDNFDDNWVLTAARPWDPPLIEAGKIRAFNVGKEFRTQLDFKIDRVFVSPFLRCVQTAAEVIKGLCSIDDEASLSFDFSSVKVSIEYGLCEMLNSRAIRSEVAPKDGNFNFNLSELEAMLPAGTVDHTVEKILSKMPLWEESDSGIRYKQVIKALADKYPRENLLLVTHGEGVATAVTTIKKDALVYSVNYCAYSHAKRSIIFAENGSFNDGSFELLNASNETNIGWT